MKRKLRIICSIASTGVGVLLTGCNGFITSTKIADPNPPEKIKYDINYYEKLKKQTLSYIKETKLLIQEIKDTKGQYENELEYQSDIDEVTIELFTYESDINEYDYQILLLQSSGFFNANQKLLATKLLKNKIANLKQQLSLMEKYLDRYQKDALKAIRNLIKETESILQQFITKEVNYVWSSIK